MQLSSNLVVVRLMYTIQIVMLCYVMLLSQMYFYSYAKMYLIHSGASDCLIRRVIQSLQCNADKVCAVDWIVYCTSTLVYCVKFTIYQLT